MIRNAQRGFTLIELVVVIVILGILAAFAVPKFMGLEDTARAAAINAMGGSLRGAASMAYGVAEATNAAGATGSIKVNGAPIPMVWGYPAASAAGIAALLQDTTGFTVTAAGGGEKFAANGAKTANCWVTYKAATQTAPFTLSYAIAGTPAAIQTYLNTNC